MGRQVVKKLSPLDQPTGRRLDTLRKGNGCVNLSRDNPVKMGFFTSNKDVNLPQGVACFPDSASKIFHAPKFVVTLQNTQEVPNAKYPICSDTTNMDRWPQRKNFIRHLEEYRGRTGASISEVASALGVSEASVYSYCTRPQSQPSENTKKAAAALFSCSVTEFIDDPGSVPEGMDPVQWARVSDRDRVLASAMLEDLSQIPEDEKEAYYQLWKQGVMIGRARMMAEERAKKASEGKGGKKP